VAEDQEAIANVEDVAGAEIAIRFARRLVHPFTQRTTAARKLTMAVVTTLDIAGLTAEDYGRILDRIGVEKRSAGGICQHIAHATDNGYRIIEIWDD
jgi:hypothetical protein